MGQQTSPRNVRPQYWSIQYLRGLAAIAVVIYHVYDTGLGPAGKGFEVGAYGVDLFFVISGFIMYAVARSQPEPKFLARRLIRIFPFYWIATVVYIAIVFLLMGFRPSGTETMLSLALMPHFNEAHPTHIWPILIPGWTLSYELYFYGLFALGLWARRPILVPTLTIAAMILLGLVLRPENAVLQVATNVLLIEFVLGMFLAKIVVSGGRWSPVVAALAPIVAAGAWLAGLEKATVMASALALVASALVIEARRPGRPIAGLRLLGDASYAIYLFHFPVLAIIEQSGLAATIPASGNFRMALALFATVAAIGSGVLIHLLIEKRMLRVLNGWADAGLARLRPAGIRRERRGDA